MDDYVVLINTYSCYNISRYSESSGSSDLDSDSISDTSLFDNSDISLFNNSDTSFSGRELQLKEVAIPSRFDQDFNNNNHDVEKIDDNGSNDGDHSSSEDCDDSNQDSGNKSSFKALSFVCTVKGCPRKFTIKSDLKRHIRDYHIKDDDLLEKHQQKVHENPILYVCKEKRCYKSYGSMKHLEIHQQNKGHEGVIQSMNKFYTRNNRIQRQRISLNRVLRKTYRCSKPGCNSSFDELSGYVNHLQVHPDGETQKVHHCNKLGCNRFFTNLYDLWNHARFGHTTERTYLCEESGCYRSFDTLYGLWVHQRSHIRENPELQKNVKDNEIKIYTRMYPCKVPGCDRVFDNKSAVATHKRYHTKLHVIEESYDFDDPEYDKKSEDLFEDNFTHEDDEKVYDELENFHSQNLRESNEQQSDNENDKLDQTKVYCDVQECVFKTDKFEILKKHLYDDHNIRNYHVCDKEGCDFCCTNDSNFQKHQQIHVDAPVVHVEEKLFKCNNCDKVFKRSCHLGSHIRIHKNRKNQKSTTLLNDKQQDRSRADEAKLLIPYVYIENVNLDVKQYFKQKNNYCCDHPGCPYVSKQLGNLMRHKMIHTGEKRFSCDIDECDYKCIQKIQLDKHKLACLNRRMSVPERQVPEQRVQVSEQQMPKQRVSEQRVFEQRVPEQPMDVKTKKKFFCDQVRCGKRFYMLADLENHKRDEHDHDGTGNEIYDNNEMIKKGSYELRKRDRISYKREFVVNKTKITCPAIKKRPRLDIHKIYPRLRRHACDHQGCSKRYITLAKLNKHKAKAHPKNMNEPPPPILKSQSENYNRNEHPVKNIQTENHNHNEYTVENVQTEDHNPNERPVNNQSENHNYDEHLVKNVNHNHDEHFIKNVQSEIHNPNEHPVKNIQTENHNHNEHTVENVQSENHNPNERPVKNQTENYNHNEHTVESVQTENHNHNEHTVENVQSEIHNYGEHFVKNVQTENHNPNEHPVKNVQSENHNPNECPVKNNQILITTADNTDDVINRKRSGTSDDNSERVISSYGLRKRPRINKIDPLDDDNDCLCKFTGCRKIFDSVRSLKVHQQKFHMITKTYSCNKSGCNFRTKFSEKLEKHQLNHKIPLNL